MTLSELFNIPESKEDFHTEYFPTKLMDSEVWTFPVTDKGIYDMAKSFAMSVGKGEVEAKHGSEDTKDSTPY